MIVFYIIYCALYGTDLFSERELLVSKLLLLYIIQAQLEQNDVGAKDRIAMEEDLKQLRRDTDLRNAQIADLQQKILDSDQGKTSTSLIIH